MIGFVNLNAILQDHYIYKLFLYIMNKFKINHLSIWNKFKLINLDSLNILL